MKAATETDPVETKPAYVNLPTFSISTNLTPVFLKQKVRERKLERQPPEQVFFMTSEGYS